MEFSEVDGGKKGVGEGGESCSIRESINKSGSDERPVDECLIEDEEKKKKLVYVVMVEYPDFDLRLMKINPHDTTSSSGFQDITPKNPPKNFKNLMHYRVAALEQNLYFIGGYRQLAVNLPGRCSNKVVVFNTHTRRWDKSFPSMKLPRAFPNVLIYDKTIYVFGFDTSLMAEDESLRKRNISINKHWAEFYDPAKKKWKYLDSVNDPPEGFLQQGAIGAAACEEQQCILFHSFSVGLYGYKVDKGLWFQVNECGYTGLRRTDTIAVRKCRLFWHHSGTIYANRLRRVFPSSELPTLPDVPYPCGEVPANESCIPCQSFLVNAGNGVFGLLYQCSIAFLPEQDQQQEQLAFHIFKLQHSPSEGTPYLLHSPDYRRTLPAKAHADVIEVLVV